MPFAFAFAFASAAAASLLLLAHSPGPDLAFPVQHPTEDSSAAIVLQAWDSSYMDTGTSLGAAAAGPAQAVCTALLQSYTAVACPGAVQLVQVGVGAD